MTNAEYFGLCSRGIQLIFISCNWDSSLARVALRLNAKQENLERWKRLFYPSTDKNLVLYVRAEWLLIFTCAHAKKATTWSQIDLLFFLELLWIATGDMDKKAERERERRDDVQPRMEFNPGLYSIRLLCMVLTKLALAR